MSNLRSLKKIFGKNKENYKKIALVPLEEILDLSSGKLDYKNKETYGKVLEDLCNYFLYDIDKLEPEQRVLYAETIKGIITFLTYMPTTTSSSLADTTKLANDKIFGRLAKERKSDE